MSVKELPTAESGVRPLLIELKIPVCTYDIDYGGVVSNIVYIRWLEDMRMKLLTTHLTLRAQVELGLAAVVASTHIEYKRPIRILDEPTGRMWMKDLGKRRWTVEAEFIVNDVVTTTAIQTGAFVSLETLKPIAPPAQIAELFNNYFNLVNKEL